MSIVHWRELVQKHFADEKLFEQITRNLLYCERAGKSPSEAFGKLGIEIQDKYDKTRWFMRSHGWYSSYIEKDFLRFWCTEPQGREYITLAKYMDLQQTAGIEKDIDEYYQTRDIIDTVSEGLSEPHSRKDIYDDEGEFIK
jgi:hypothetical protein